MQEQVSNSDGKVLITDMNMKNPEYILEIGRQRNLSKAAQNLFIAQSTLSQYLLNAEKELGTALFLRTKAGLAPTPAGSLYLQTAAEIMELNRRAEQGIQALSGMGTLRIGVCDWCLRTMIDVLPSYKRQFPDMTVELTDDNYYVHRRRMREGKLDFVIGAVVEGDVLPEDHAQVLFEEDVKLVVPRNADMGIADECTVLEPSALPGILKDTGFIVSDERSTVRVLEEKLFESLLFRPRIICEIDRKDFTMELIAGGIGAAFIPERSLLDRRVKDYVSRVRSFSLSPALKRAVVMAFREDLVMTDQISMVLEEIRQYAQKEMP